MTTYFIRIEKVTFLVDISIWKLSESFVKSSRNRRCRLLKGRHSEYHYPTYRPIPGHLQLLESLGHLGQRNTKNDSSIYGEDCWIFLLSSFWQRLFFPFPVWTSPLKKKGSQFCANSFRITADEPKWGHCKYLAHRRWFLNLTSNMNEVFNSDHETASSPCNVCISIETWLFRKDQYVANI